MVSPGELRLVDALSEKDAFEPEIADDGAVSYPDAVRLLDEGDGDPAGVLERFTARGVLTSEFVSKVYVCPECATEGLQYTTVCPACDSPHTVETSVLEHDCGYVGPESKFDAEEGSRCPECERSPQPDDLEEARRHVCNDCPEITEDPADRLWCRSCLSMFPPRETVERVLHRYSLSADGEEWLERKKGALETVAEMLQERRFETEIDATVTGESTSRSVHVLAEDEQMGEKRIVSLHETPDTERVDAFCEFAASVGAHPIVITTSGAVEEEVAERADGSELTVLAYEGDGTLGATYETVENVDTHQQGLFQRLTAALDVPVRTERS